MQSENKIKLDELTKQNELLFEALKSQKFVIEATNEMLEEAHYHCVATKDALYAILALVNNLNNIFSDEFNEDDMDEFYLKMMNLISNTLVGKYAILNQYEEEIFVGKELAVPFEESVNDMLINFTKISQINNEK